MTLRDLYLLCERYVPRRSRHWGSLDRGRSGWWPAHELGHLLTTSPEAHGKPMFGLDDGDEHEVRCRELAAMSVSRRLLAAAGRHDLARDEIDVTDTITREWEDRGRVAEILAEHRVQRLPRTAAGLEQVIRRAVSP